MSSRPRPRRRVLGALGLLGVAALLACCGIPQDSEPREISRDDLPPELIDQAATGSTVDGNAEVRRVTLYLVRDGRLVGVAAEIPRTSNADLPRAVAEALLAASPPTDEPDVTNPLATTSDAVWSASLADNVVDLDLDELDGPRSTQRLAIAQLVFTLTELMVPRIDGVRVSVAGTPVAVPVAGGVIEAGVPVRPDDDVALAPD